MPALAESPASRNGVSPNNNGRHNSQASAPTASAKAEAPGPAREHAESLVEAIVFDYFTLSAPMPVLSRRHNMSLEQLATLLESAPVQSLIRRLTRLAAQRASALAVQNRASAVASLETTIATTDDPETSRKAAATLIRASDRVLYPTRRRRKAKQEPVAQAETITGAPTAPDPGATPSQATQCEATQDSPTSNPDSSSAPPGGRLRGEHLTAAPPPRRSSSGAG